ncbi:diacylglycerol/lipid kinase family protein [Caulobacter hibisci]|uniref:Diacylglycerol kinase family lipid kinase n=1 Tax=Caulobacter hibisci TaxID=2035993 RepID=A0ABS0SUN9_9CAUL|nr:diacylglycerol kinase family protein [Caulobacter hibisci]MBI1683329.1 diacylglycerol kinase family lipid kinase [Caulobacter hibisci]
MRAELIANVASGSVGRDAPERAKAILAEHGVDGTVCAPASGELETCLTEALARKPDVLFVLAGDGTARAAAEMAGPDGPMIAPLPGGTMNMLPRALYGERAWPQALAACLTHGEERMISGGEVAGKLFFVAAILGSPALWAEAREAARQGRADLAIMRAQRALRRAFSSRLRYVLDGRPKEKAEALTLMCPLVSTGLAADERALEAAALDPTNALDIFRLGVKTVTGDWRDDPSVSVQRCRIGRAWAGGRIPAILDGEPTRLDDHVSIRFRPKAFRALALKDDAP